MRGAKETFWNALLRYCANISNVFNIVNIRKIDNSKYWQYPYNWQIQILTISTKLYQCLILTRWASSTPFFHQKVPAKKNNIKAKTCISCLQTFKWRGKPIRHRNSTRSLPPPWDARSSSSRWTIQRSVTRNQIQWTDQALMLWYENQLIQLNSTQ